MIALDFWEKWRPMSVPLSVGLRVCAMQHSSVYICLKLKKKKWVGLKMREEGKVRNFLWNFDQK